MGRVYAKTRYVWIREQPAWEERWIGYLWFGSSVALRDQPSMGGPGCDGPWYPVEPRGYVCVDGERATLDLDDPILRQIAPYAPNLDTPWPHKYYGGSTGAPRYKHLPTADEQDMREHDYLWRWHHALGSSSATADLAPAPATNPAELSLPTLPKFLQDDRSWLPRDSAVAWNTETEHLGRTWLLTGDLTWVPKDRVVPYSRHEFQGVHLGPNAKLPLAFFREKDRPQYVKAESGEIHKDSAQFPRLSWVQLTGEQIEQGGKRFLQTSKPDVYVDADDAVVPQVRKETLWGAATLQPDKSGKTPPGRATWIEANIMGGWLIAYEGTQPVFVTLISPGLGGAATKGEDPVETAATPTGFFQINGKFATASMAAPNDLMHSDVPWTQNFSGPHALHAAYWHDSWGEKKSGGCINLSPIDAKWLFDFTEPPLPVGWHGLRWQRDLEPSTFVLINKN
jgi:hypothetical protein